MIIKSLKLKNIRSYTDQIIDFPDKSIMLSGDIGSGKSTLLLAIEFALFGINKSDLTGESLLRKGSLSASVELVLELNNQEITIQRNLKKNKETVTQISGHLILNNLKKELTPVELKSEIIKILNYPEDQITKSKNYVFRYTVYCPQEEMKQILLENPEDRLETLKKIFNIDKYKKIRENIEITIKEIKDKSTILKERTSCFDQKKTQLNTLRELLNEIKNQINIIQPQLEKINISIQDKKEEIFQLEEKNKEHLKIKNNISSLSQLLSEKKKQQQKLEQKKQEVNNQLNQIIVDITEEKAEEERKNLQAELHQFITTESKITAKIQNCQEKINKLQKDISELTERVQLVNEKTDLVQKLELELQKKEDKVRRKEELELELNEINRQIHLFQAISNQAIEIKNKISRLQHCPTCYQEVPDKHKEEIIKEQQQKENESQTKLNELNKNKFNLEKERVEININIDLLNKKENILIKTRMELENILEKQKEIKNKKEELQDSVKLNNDLMTELIPFSQENYTLIKKRNTEIQEKISNISRKKELEKNITENHLEQTEIKKQIEDLTQKEKELIERLNQFPDLTIIILQQKQVLEVILNTEKKLFSEKVRWETQKEGVEKQTQELVTEVDQLHQQKAQLIRWSETQYWLEEFLIKLTYTIEKQVMLKIHFRFNQLFSEWFSIMMENEDFSARLDDSFTPIIEQNGYEINFGNLSGGERTAASLSYRLALNKVINEIIPEIKTKDLLILDEPTDGFSSEQLDKVREVLERLNLKQTIIVSHESIIESFVDNVIRINKEGNISKIN